MYSITKDGGRLAKSLYTIDEKNKVFSSLESDLVLDFAGLGGWVFKTGYGCVFTTGWYCVFKTGSNCTFKTSAGCTFDTGSDCVFKTGSNCTLLCHDNKTYRYFLDKSNYVFTKEQLIEIKDKNSAILNSKHESELVRNLCKDILKG